MDFKLSLLFLLVMVVVQTNGTFYHFTGQYPVNQYHIGYSHGQRILWCKYPSGRTRILRQWPLYTPKVRTLTMNTANLINFQNNLRLRKNLWSNAVLPDRQAFVPQILRSDAVDPVPSVTNALVTERQRNGMWDVLGINKNSAGLDKNGQIQKVMNDPIFILFPPVDLSKLTPVNTKPDKIAPVTGFKTADPTIAADKLDTNVLDPINIPVDPVVLETVDKPNIVDPIQPTTDPILPPIVPAVLEKVVDFNTPDTTSVPIVPVTVDTGSTVPVTVDNSPVVVPVVDATTIVDTSSDVVLVGSHNTTNPDLSKITDILPTIDVPPFVDSVITNEIIDPVIPGPEKIPTDKPVIPPVIDNPIAKKDHIGPDNLPTPTAVVPIIDIPKPKTDEVPPVKPPKVLCQITGCEQGSSCVSMSDGTICLQGMPDRQCECRLGCRLGPNFIPLGSSLTVDECGNICGCNNMFGQTECTQYMCNPDAVGAQTLAPSVNNPFSKTDIRFPVPVPNANSITNDVISTVNNNNVIFPQNNPVDLSSVTQDLPGLSFPQGQLQSVAPDTREFIDAPEPDQKLPNTNIPDATKMVNSAVGKINESTSIPLSSKDSLISSDIKPNSTVKPIVKSESKTNDLVKDTNFTAFPVVTPAENNVKGIAVEKISKTMTIINSKPTITNELIKEINSAQKPLLNSEGVLAKDTGLDTKQIIISKQTEISASENHASSDTKLLIHTNQLESKPIVNNNAFVNNAHQLENGFVKNAKIFVENKIETTTQKIISTSDNLLTSTQKGEIVTESSTPFNTVTEKTNQPVPISTSSTTKQEDTSTIQNTSQNSTKHGPVSISVSVTETTSTSTQPMV